MTPSKTGQIVKFHTPFEDEDPNQLYVVLEIKGDDDSTRVDIKALNTGLAFPPISTVILDELEVAMINTSDLIGHTVIIDQADYSQVSGKVVEVIDQNGMFDLNKEANGVETNVRVTIKANNGKVNTGTLFVK